LAVELGSSVELTEEAPMVGRLPQFLGIGAQKGGTTTLQRLLEQHPGVYLPPSKEVHYFSLHYAKGERWYLEQFHPAEPGQMCGEITPYYLFHPEAPRRVHALLPEARLIVLLRDPVERTLSQYFHSVRLGLEPLPLEEALAAEVDRLAGAETALSAPDGLHRSHQEHSYVARSRYEKQLLHWYQYFEASQFLVMRSEDLFLNPADAWQRVQDFLGLNVVALPSVNVQANAGLGESDAVVEQLRDSLRLQLHETYEWTGRSYGMLWEV
jgi:hypothetical protein